MSLKENRVAIMLSDDELRLIDDYRFASRIPTRAKAMRGLIEQGLSSGDMLEALRLIDSYLYATAPESNERQIVNAAISKAEGR